MNGFKNSTKMTKGHVMPSVGKVMSAMKAPSSMAVKPMMGKGAMKPMMKGGKVGC